MSKPPDDSTPSRGASMTALTFAPTAQMRTTQATFVAVIAAAFVCGGYLMSIDNKLSNQAQHMDAMQSNVNELMRAVFYNDPRITSPKTQPKVNAP